MGIRTIQLADGDPKALAWMKINMDFCVYVHALSRKLMNQFSLNDGSVTVIIPDWVDIGSLHDYSQGSIWPKNYQGHEDNPKTHLRQMATEYLR